jgi:hypothetical protein
MGINHLEGDMSISMGFSRGHWFYPKGTPVRRELPDTLWPSRRLALAHLSHISCLSMAGEVISPPYVITADDKRGLIVVTGAAVLAFVWSCFLIRVWLRMQSREWRSDGECFLYLRGI